MPRASREPGATRRTLLLGRNTMWQDGLLPPSEGTCCRAPGAAFRRECWPARNRCCSARNSREREPERERQPEREEREREPEVGSVTRCFSPRGPATRGPPPKAGRSEATSKRSRTLRRSPFFAGAGTETGAGSGAARSCGRRQGHARFARRVPRPLTASSARGACGSSRGGGAPRSRSPAIGWLEPT